MCKAIMAAGSSYNRAEPRCDPREAHILNCAVIFSSAQIRISAFFPSSFNALFPFLFQTHLPDLVKFGSLSGKVPPLRGSGDLLLATQGSRH
jgi:hypothetical protein